MRASIVLLATCLLLGKDVKLENGLSRDKKHILKCVLRQQGLHVVDLFAYMQIRERNCAMLQHRENEVYIY